MKNFVVDVEADGPCPGLYSMISFGAVLVEPGILQGEPVRGFSRTVAPIGEHRDEAAAAVTGTTVAMHNSYPPPKEVMKQFHEWLDTLRDTPTERLTLWSDNPAFDWQWINYYFHKYRYTNPFGFSARRIGDFYAGYQRNFKKANDWKKYRKTTHNHDPLEDAKGNAEALLMVASLASQLDFFS